MYESLIVMLLRAIVLLFDSSYVILTMKCFLLGGRKDLQPTIAVDEDGILINYALQLFALEQ